MALLKNLVDQVNFVDLSNAYFSDPFRSVLTHSGKILFACTAG